MKFFYGLNYQLSYMYTFVLYITHVYTIAITAMYIMQPPGM